MPFTLIPRTCVGNTQLLRTYWRFSTYRKILRREIYAMMATKDGSLEYRKELQDFGGLKTIPDYILMQF